MNFRELIETVKNIPYGRNCNRYDFSLVLSENKGSCSSKHAFIKEFASKNNIENVQLFIGVFKMNEENTPKIGNILTTNNLRYIPEAHCYLKVNDVPIDVTSKESFYDKIKNEILIEIEIEPEQVIEYKVNYHQQFIKKWIIEKKINKSFEEIWKIRENCIKNLSENLNT